MVLFLGQISPFLRVHIYYLSLFGLLFLSYLALFLFRYSSQLFYPLVDASLFPVFVLIEWHPLVDVKSVGRDSTGRRGRAGTASTTAGPSASSGARQRAPSASSNSQVMVS